MSHTSLRLLPFQDALSKVEEVLKLGAGDEGELSADEMAAEDEISSLSCDAATSLDSSEGEEEGGEKEEELE